ncbi:MAG: succinate dehydrogenase cytochrome b subunit [Proteobacteria bacterium]|nr:MAG: succinate dehydrogenase cytochrome b subunit [Pseudomonadota bacterium]
MKKEYWSSTVFKKFVMGATGLALLGFVITHLLGNLLLYKKEGMAFNEYAHKLEGFGPLLWAAEIGLLGFFVYHAITGIRLAFLARTAKPKKYAINQSKGGPSKWGVSSNNMAITGTVLLIFVALHVWHFKYGPGLNEGYVTALNDGSEARDLQRHVVEQFKNPLIVGLYVFAMLGLGLHLRHGVWSAFQSLGLTRENNTKTIYTVGGALAAILAAGFLFIPVYIYFLY